MALDLQPLEETKLDLQPMEPDKNAPKEEWEQYYKDTIEPKSDIPHDIGVIGKHFANQYLLNAPRSLGNTYGKPIDFEAKSPAANVAAKVAGVAGALANPIGQVAREAGLLKQALGGASVGALYSPNENFFDVGQRAAQGIGGAVIAPIATKVLNTVGGAIAPNKGKLADEATRMYRDILRPTQGEVKKLEIRQGKDINDYYNLAAQEGLKINKAGEKLDTSEAIEVLNPKVAEIHKKLDQYLASDTTTQFNLRKIATRAKNELTEKIKNASELKSAQKQVDDLISAEIATNGVKVNAQTLNRIKQGMWDISYDALAPNKKDIARKIGFITKETIERAFPNKNIKELNELSGKYQTLKTLLGNAHERVIKGGRLGHYFANIVGAVAGRGLGIPVVGELVGAAVGGSVSRAINDPAIASAIAANKAMRAGISGVDFARVMGKRIKQDPNIIRAIVKYSKKTGKKFSEVVEEVKSGLPEFHLGLSGRIGEKPSTVKFEPKQMRSTLTPEEASIAKTQTTPYRQETLREFRGLGKGGFVSTGKSPKDFATAEEYVASKGIFNTDTTGISHFDNLFGKIGNEIDNVEGITQREYFKKNKNTSADIVYMSPDEYIKNAAMGQWEASSKKVSFDEFLKDIQTRRVSEESLSRLRKAISEGKKINMPYLEYDKEGLYGQEGYHRALIAKEMGLKEMPVLLVKKETGITPLDSFIGKQSQLTAEWEAAQKGINQIGSIAKSPLGMMAGTSAAMVGGAAIGNASEDIDMTKISQIESSNNPEAYNAKSQARGKNQITPIVLKEWNNYHKSEQHGVKDLFNEEINDKIANWYMNKRIPQMLKAKKIKDTVENRLIAYNYGIGNIGKPLPLETRNYLKKYRGENVGQ